MSAHSEIVKRGDLSDIHKWCKSALHGTESERGASWQIGGILAVLERLADEDVPPFSDTPLVVVEDDAAGVRQDSSDLPEDFRYLVGPAIHFGERYSDDVRASAFLEEASEREKEWLATVAERVRVNDQWRDILQWLKHTGAKHIGYNWEIATLFELMDLSGFNFEGNA